MRIRLFQGGKEVSDFLSSYACFGLSIILVMGRLDRFDQLDFCHLHLQIVDTGVLEDVEGLVGGRLGLFCKSQVSSCLSSSIGYFIFVLPRKM